ncbi:hypothetical protein LBMAG33_6080 [Candidatus Levyibacteriota bacterium]|nr:hypothetical protein LBMAG33_6080 [Candidatus Levybacteria bacterium]
MNKKEKIILLLIILLGTFFRIYGINWDQNQHLHPDERFLTMVTESIKWPNNIYEYFSTDRSTLNPHNMNFSFFIYGTFPIFLTKFLSEIFKYTDYSSLTIFGRFLSGFFDILVIIIVFLIGRVIFSIRAGLAASFIYSISVLPIQLSHFYATDTFLNFFLISSFYLLIRYVYSRSYFWIIPSGVTYGIALASKISAITYISSFIIIFLLIINLKKRIFISIIYFCLIIFLTFRIFQPYAFLNKTFFNFNPKFIQNLQELKYMSQPGSTFPPSIQWNNTPKIIFPLKNIIFWGMGIPIATTSLLGIIYAIFIIFKKRKKIFNNFWGQDKKTIITISIISNIIIVFIFQSIQFVKPLRYFIIIYPLLSILSGLIINDIFNFTYKKNPKISIILGCIWLSTLIIWPFSFISIYRNNHSRVYASEWIYINIPHKSILGIEHWDDGLPLSLDVSRINNLYKFEELPMFNADSEEKWLSLNEKFEKIDYIIITSNRAYGSLYRLPEKYPITIQYYKDLFNDKLRFKKIAEFISRPSIFGFEFIDDNADETFTVYDHPRVSIFKKIKL